MSLEALLLQACGGLANGLVDTPERLLARQRVVRKYQIKIDREPRHVAHEQVDRRAALERERIVDEHERSDARQ